MTRPPGEPGAASGDSRRRGREAALQMLYQWEVGRLSMPEVRRTFWAIETDEPETTARIQAFAIRLADGTIEALPAIDPLIEASAEHWRLSRMPIIDRLILRLAVYEFLHEAETPRAVAIDEALELARRFSTPDAVKFINGVLDGVKRRIESDARE